MTTLYPSFPIHVVYDFNSNFFRYKFISPDLITLFNYLDSDFINKQVIYPKFVFILENFLMNKVYTHDYISLENNLYFLITCFYTDATKTFTLLVCPLSNNILYSISPSESLSNISDNTSKINTIFNSLYNNTKNDFSITTKIAIIEDKLQDIEDNIDPKELVTKKDFTLSYFITLIGFRNLIILFLSLFLLEITTVETLIRPNYKKIIERVYDFILPDD